MEYALKDKKILIVGGSSGIGLEVARQIYNSGARVVIASRSSAKRRDVLENTVGQGIETLSCDITSDHDVKALLDAAGPIDHLVITVRPDVKAAFFMDLAAADAKQAFESKLWGPYRLIQAARNHIAPDGSIVMTTGIAGDKVFKGSAAMGMVNSTIEACCRFLAVELAPIRVNAVSPGFVEPKADEIQKYALQFPIPRLARLDEIARAYVYLMTNTYTTGITVVVDGGARLI